MNWTIVGVFIVLFGCVTILGFVAARWRPGNLDLLHEWGLGGRRFGTVVTSDDPWGFGNSLEWATSCPPPRHNFTELPRIRSERPAFELHYPYMVERMRAESHVRSEEHTLNSSHGYQSRMPSSA